MYCSNCGKEIPNNVNFCFHCGTRTNQTDCFATGETTISPQLQQSNAVGVSSTGIETGDKSFIVTLVLSMLPAPWGLHRFYTGRIVSGLIQFFTVGLYFIWSSVDVLLIVTNNFKDAQGRKLKGYNRGLAFVCFIIWLLSISCFVYAIATSSMQDINKKNVTTAEETISTSRAVSSDDSSSNPDVCTEQKSTQQEEGTTANPRTINSSEKGEKKNAVFKEAPHVAVINENAVVFMSPERAQGIDYLYGEGKAKQIQELLPVAAKLVAEHKNCDEVVKVDFDDVYSTPSTPKIYVLSKNKKEVIFTLQEVEQNIKITDNRLQAPKYRAPIRAGAVFKYPETKTGLIKAGFPKMLKKLGLDNIKKANKLIPFAARKAAQNFGCDAVMTADISDKSTKEKLVFYVHAENYTKFYFTEAELLTDTPTVSEQEKLAPLLIRHEVMAEEVIKSKLNYPSTYDRHELGVFTSRTTPNCNEITIEFSAKNAYNLELTYIATVQFDKESNVVGFYMQEKR